MSDNSAQNPGITVVDSRRSKFAWVSRKLLPVSLVIFVIYSLQPQRLIAPNWDNGGLDQSLIHDLYRTPLWELSVPAGSLAQAGSCPGPDCPLNPKLRSRFLTERSVPGAVIPAGWRVTPPTIALRAGITAWRSTHYSRIETTLPSFATVRGTAVAFDVLGIAGKNWRLFVNGIEKANGKGGLLNEPIVFLSDGGKTGDPLTLGIETDAGRTFMPGIVSLSQPFLSPPSIAPAVRAAYRGIDKEKILPDTWARSMLALLVAFAAMLTPFYLELLVFSVGVVLWNYNTLLGNDLTIFPADLRVDYTTMRATFNCLFYASLFAFHPLFFRIRNRLAFVPAAIFCALALGCFLAGRFGQGIFLVPFVLRHHYLFFSLTCLTSCLMALNTAKATSRLPHAIFRMRIAKMFCVILGFQSTLAVAMQLGVWGVPGFEALADVNAVFKVAKLNESNILLFGIVMGLDWALVVRDRQRVLQRFGMVIDPRLMKEIVTSPNLPSIRAERVVALFVDLRSFSQMCEEYAPQEVNLALNEYLDVVTKAVQKNNGIIDKFIGDAVMALWGVPDKSNRDPLDSVRAALDIRKGMQTLNSTRNSRGLPELHFGIGIHCGPAIFGPVGNAQRVDFTAIGPTINLSARLQSLTKERNADILISSDLYSLVADNTLVQDSGTAQIRGFSESKQVMRLLGVVDQQGVMTFHNAKLEALNLPLRPGVVIEDIPSITSNASKTEGNIKSAS